MVIHAKAAEYIHMVFLISVKSLLPFNTFVLNYPTFGVNNEFQADICIGEEREGR